MREYLNIVHYYPLIALFVGFFLFEYKYIPLDFLSFSNFFPTDGGQS